MQVKKWPLVTILLCTFCIAQTVAQKLTSVKGQVLDAATNDPLPYVSVQFEGANVGTRTDIEGNYYMETRVAGPS